MSSRSCRLVDVLEPRRLLSAGGFENPTPVVTPVYGAASLYPAPILVSGLSGKITRVTATIRDLSHTYPDDYDILLVSPSGQSVMLMSDVGGGRDASHRTITFDDAAADYLANEGPLVSGTFKPTNVGLLWDTFAAPAPALPASGVAMSAFDGSDPNGTWSIYVVDDFPADVGTIAGGWSLSIETSPDAPPPLTAQWAVIDPSPRGEAVGAATITFSRAVTGVDAADFFLARGDGSDPLCLSNATLTQVSPTQYALDLSSATALAGCYTLTLAAGGSGISDGGGNALSADATTNWLMDAVVGTAGNDTIRLSRSAAGTVDVFINNDGALPNYTIPLAGFASYPLRVLSGGGDDTIEIDAAGGSPAPSAGIRLVGGGYSADGDSLVLRGSDGNDAAAVADGACTLASTAIAYDTNFAHVRFAGGAGADQLRIDGGVYTMSQDASIDTPNLALVVGPAGEVDFAATQHLASLSIAGAAHLDGDGSTFIVTGALSINGVGQLDLGTGNLLINYAAAATSPIGGWNGSAYTGITGMLASGYHNGAWNGPGIVTRSPLAVAPVTLTTLVPIEAADLLGIDGAQTALWNGQTVDATTVLVRYTYAGDANVDGVINGDDYFQIDSAYPQGMHGWVNGDFNYDGVVSGDDYFLIDSNYSAQGAPL
jgi:hypothetical protein